MTRAAPASWSSPPSAATATAASSSRNGAPISRCRSCGNSPAASRAGESPVDALAREIAEELGCDARVGRIDEVVFHAYADFDLYMLVYACTLAGTARAVEVADIRWVPPAELVGFDVLPADVALCQRLAAEAANRP